MRTLNFGKHRIREEWTQRTCREGKKSDLIAVLLQELAQGSWGEL